MLSGNAKVQWEKKIGTKYLFISFIMATDCFVNNNIYLAKLLIRAWTQYTASKNYTVAMYCFCDNISQEREKCIYSFK